MELWVGQCSGGDTLGDASTVWNSASWIMIEKGMEAPVLIRESRLLLGAVSLSKKSILTNIEKYRKCNMC